MLIWAAAFFAGIAAFCFASYVFTLLEQLEVEKQDREEVKRLPLILRFFMPFTPNVIGITRAPSFANARNIANERILMAGFDQVIDAEHFLAIRILVSCFGIIIMAISLMLGQWLYGVILLTVLYIYPDIWLKATISKRHFQIQKALPNVLDLLTLSIEAGKDFLTSLRDILARRRVRDALHEELERTFHEIQLGKQRRQALRDLSRRVQQPDLSSVINAIVQSDELGVSIGQILRIQGDQFRTKRFQRAEKKANETPVKILLPIVLFIFPPVFIIVGAPLIMQVMKTVFK